MLEDFPGNWRDEDGIYSRHFYKRRFAWFPVKLSDNSSTFLKYYYKKYTEWNTFFNHTDAVGASGHVDFVENISSEEYVVRKLIEGH